MRKIPWLLSLGVSLFSVSQIFASACRGRPQEPEQPEYTPTATVKDLMDSILDPDADVLWDSSATVADRSGVHSLAPRTDEEWTNVRRSAIRLVEVTNLLRMPGRHVARPGEKSVAPGVELEPEEMEVMIKKDPEGWNKHAKGLCDVGLAMLQAIDARDVPALFDLGDRLDMACERCHAQYWYPNQPQPPSAQ